MFETIGEWFVDFFNKLGAMFINLDGTDQPLLGKIIMAILFIIVAWLLIKIFCGILKKIFGIKKTNNIDKSAKSFIVSAIKVLLWLVVAFIVLNILGVDVTSFAGILSAVTVALGLALQDVISTFAAGVIIINQKNFLTGDYIEISNAYGKVEGTVVKVSFMSTQMNTLDNQMVFVPNGNIIKANLTNYTREKLRRVVYKVNVSYDVDTELVKKILTDIVQADERITEERPASIHVNALLGYSVEFIIKAWTDHTTYWDVYNSLSEKILLAFRENGIEIPSSNAFIVKNEGQQ